MTSTFSSILVADQNFSQCEKSEFLVNFSQLAPDSIYDFLRP